MSERLYREFCPSFFLPGVSMPVDSIYGFMVFVDARSVICHLPFCHLSLCYFWYVGTILCYILCAPISFNLGVVYSTSESLCFMGVTPAHLFLFHVICVMRCYAELTSVAFVLFY